MPSDKTLQVWRDNGYQGDTATFTESQYDPGKDDVRYDGGNTFDEVDDSISSLKTGTNCWCVMFDYPKYEYTGGIIKVSENTSLDFTGDTWGVWNDRIASFKIFDTKPFYFYLDTTSDAGDVWLKTYENKWFSTGYVPTAQTIDYYTVYFDRNPVNNYLYGIGYVENDALLNRATYYADDGIATLHYFVVSSLKTGASTWVTLYTGDERTGSAYNFGPNTDIADMTLYGPIYYRSLDIFDTEPSGWTGSSEQVPAIVTRLQNYATASKLDTVFSDLLGLIPEVGTVISLLNDALWPTGPSSLEVWDDLRQYIDATNKNLVDREALDYLEKQLGGIGNDLSDYENLVASEEKLDKLNIIISDILQLEPSFLGTAVTGEVSAETGIPGATDTPEKLLTFQVAFCSIGLTLLWLRAEQYVEISGDSTDPNKGGHEETLNGKVTTYTQAVQTAVKNALTWRKSLLSIEGSGNTMYVYDAYNGFIYGNKALNSSQASSELTSLQTSVVDDYEQQLAWYTQPASLWPYLSSENTSAPSSVTKTYSFSAGQKNSSKVYDLRGKTLDAIFLYTSTGNTSHTPAIEIYINGVSQGRYGLNETTKYGREFDDGEQVVSVYGRSGDQLDQLAFRTNLGRDNTMGGSGGDPFSYSAPQGVDAELVSMEVGEVNDEFSYIAMNYEYTAYE